MYTFFPGIAGAAIFWGTSPSNVQGTLGTLSLASDVTVFQAFVMELILTLLFVFVVFTVNFSTAKESYGYTVVHRARVVSVSLCRGKEKQV